MPPKLKTKNRQNRELTKIILSAQIEKSDIVEVVNRLENVVKIYVHSETVKHNQYLVWVERIKLMQTIDKLRLNLAELIEASQSSEAPEQEVSIK